MVVFVTQRKHFLCFFGEYVILEDYKKCVESLEENIVRIIRSVFLCIDNQHRHLVSNNSIRYFASRFQYYNSCFRRKYQAINGVMTPAYWSRVAVFSDGTKFYTTKNVRQNFSGHKKRYCLSMLETTGPDGLYLEIDVNPGRYNDDMQQNVSNLGHRIVACQNAYGTDFESGVDKGMHRTVGVRPMHNHLQNTVQEDIENNGFSSCRVTNEHDIGRSKYQWKYFEFHKGIFLNNQPLAVFRRVSCILTNALTCCERNSTSKHYKCFPMTLEEYFALGNGQH